MMASCAALCLATQDVEDPAVVVFYREGCEDCLRMEPVLKELEALHPDLGFRYIEGADPDAPLMWSLATAYGVDSSAVPGDLRRQDGDCRRQPRKRAPVAGRRRSLRPVFVPFAARPAPVLADSVAHDPSRRTGSRRARGGLPRMTVARLTVLGAMSRDSQPLRASRGSLAPPPLERDRDAGGDRPPPQRARPRRWRRPLRCGRGASNRQ